MSGIVILGAGPSGAASALMLARRGHDVTVLDRDPGPRPNGLEHWKRTHLPHVRQGHSFLALGTRVLSLELPDVVEKLLAAGAVRVTLAHDPSDWNLLSRRLLVDAVLRDSLSSEPGVSFRRSTTAVGLLIDRPTVGPPRVIGVKTADDDIRADVVIDACGSHSPVTRWLAGHQIALNTYVDPSHFFYLTRHYRLRRSAAFPAVRVPIIASLDYAAALAFPEDNGHFQLTVQLSRSDPSSRALRHADAFETFLAAVPLMAPWLAAGEALGDPEIVGTVGNGRRRTCCGEPLVTGLLLLGDAAFHTNPSAARGVAVGLAHAQALANMLDAAGNGAHDAARLTETWEQVSSGLLDPFLESQVRIDRQRLAQVQCSIEGRPWAGENDTHRLAQAFQEQRDCAIVGAAADRLFNLLSTPADVYAQAEVMRRVVRHLRSRSKQPATLGPSRREYERLVGGVAHGRP